jgi:tripartite-type tricarboxylate transporter receptor subunit TctC
MTPKYLHPTPRLDRPLQRRGLLKSAGGSALAATWLAAGLPLSARAQAYPSRPIKMVMAFPPAGATDILGRAIGQRLGELVGLQVVPDNRPGAGGMIGMDAAAKSAPDGYSVFLCALTNTAIAGHLYPNATSDIGRDFEPISLVANGAHVLNVHPGVPARNLAEFVAWLKANDGKVNYASQGNGTLSHLESELLLQRLGIRQTHVPYKGSSQALPDLLSGTVSFMFDSVAASMAHIKAGTLRPLAVAATQRVPALADLPTVSEGGVPGYDVDNWFGYFAPKGTPPAVIAMLNGQFEKVMAQADFKATLVQQGYIVTHAGPERLAAVTTAERAKWGEVIRAAKIKL